MLHNNKIEVVTPWPGGVRPDLPVNLAFISSGEHTECQAFMPISNGTEISPVRH